MQTQLILQPFPALPGAPVPRLLLDVTSGDCAVLNPPADPQGPTLSCIAETIQVNRLSLEWVLYSAADRAGYLGGQALKRQFVAARVATGAWTQPGGRNDCYQGKPDRLLAEGERLQLGTSFARVCHLTDDEQIYTGYLFERFACLGAPWDRLRPLEPDPLEQWPGQRIALV